MSRPGKLMLWLECPRWSSLLYGPLLLVMGIGFVSEPRDRLIYSCGIVLLVTATSWLGLGIVWHEGRRNWMRYWMLILSVLSAIIITTLITTGIYELYTRL